VINALGGAKEADLIMEVANTMMMLPSAGDEDGDGSGRIKRCKWQ
jgi:hypothetical protein